MTDEELVRLCAKMVMGWEWHPGDYDAQAIEGWYDASHPRWTPEAYDDWNPLISDSECCRVVDRMVGQGWECRTYAMPSYSLHQPIAPGHKCEFAKLNMDEPAPVFRGYGPAGAEGRRRAIVMTALKAVGVSIPTPA